MSRQDRTSKAKGAPIPGKSQTDTTVAAATPALLQRAQMIPSTLTSNDVKHLQRTIGNRATVGLLSRALPIQTKLTLGPAVDKYEQEADQVAAQVVRQIDSSPVQRQEDEDELQTKPSLPVQRQEDEDELQMKPVAADISRLQRTPAEPIRRAFVIQRDPNDDLRSALRKRRGMVTGMSEEDVAKENALDDFLSSSGKRATEEAKQLTGTITPEGRMAAANATGIKQQDGSGGGSAALLRNRRRVAEQKEAETVEGDPFVDRIKLGDLVSKRRELGEQGFNTLLHEQKQRSSSKKPSDVGDVTSSLDEFVSGRSSQEKILTDYGEMIAYASDKQRMLQTMCDSALNTAESAKEVASWDTTQLTKLTGVANIAVKSITTPTPKKLDDVDLRVTLAQTAVGDLNERARQDIEWMESLKPYDEAIIMDGLEKMAEGDKSIMNSGMSQTWRTIVRLGSAEVRDVDAVANYFVSLLKEIDRKTPFDAEVAKRRMTGPSKKIQAVMTQLISRTTAKRSILDIINQEPDANTLEKFVKKFVSLDGLALILEKTTNRTDLEAIVGKANQNLPALRRIYEALSYDPAKVKFLLCGDGGQKINFLDDWFRRGGKAWQGATCTAPVFEPTGTTKEHIESVAVPKEGSSSPASGGYAGNRVFGTNTKPPDMLLPQYTTTGTAIRYKEYDTKRYYPGVNRGAERFVKGSDGRYYYTNDHYQTFRKFA